MAKITFKAKAETIYNIDDTVAYQRIEVPTLTRAHCDMPAFRSHPIYGGLANSDLFSSVLARIKRDKLGEYIRLGRVPEHVAVAQGAFLHTITIDA